MSGTLNNSSGTQPPEALPIFDEAYRERCEARHHSGCSSAGSISVRMCTTGNGFGGTALSSASTTHLCARGHQPELCRHGRAVWRESWPGRCRFIAVLWRYHRHPRNRRGLAVRLRSKWCERIADLQGRQGGSGLRGEVTDLGQAARRGRGRGIWKLSNGLTD